MQVWICASGKTALIASGNPFRPSCLWHDQDRIADARSILASIYAWFTEGFDSVPLREAKALLDELGRVDVEP